MDNTHQPEPNPESGERADSAPLSPREAEKASLRLLRDHVAKAVEEIVRQRAQNQSLVRRLAEFEATGGTNAISIFGEGTDLDEVKTKVASFISSIDTYLADQDS